MNVADLRAALDGLPDDMPVVLAKDAEGNDFSPLSGPEQGMYSARNTWSGEVYPTAEEIADPTSGYTDEDEAPDHAVRALVLWPVN